MCSTCRFILSGKVRRGGVEERREGVGGGGGGEVGLWGCMLKDLRCIDDCAEGCRSAR